MWLRSRRIHRRRAAQRRRRRCRRRLPDRQWLARRRLSLSGPGRCLLPWRRRRFHRPEVQLRRRCIDCGRPGIAVFGLHVHGGALAVATARVGPLTRRRAGIARSATAATATATATTARTAAAFAFRPSFRSSLNFRAAVARRLAGRAWLGLTRWHLAPRLVPA